MARRLSSLRVQSGAAFRCLGWSELTEKLTSMEGPFALDHRQVGSKNLLGLGQQRPDLLLASLTQQPGQDGARLGIEIQ